MERYKVALWSIGSLGIITSCAYAFRLRVPKPRASDSSSSPVIYLDQAWSQTDRDTFYWISQGTVMMSYDIFMNLEVADGQELFRSDANIDRYGLIPSPPDPQWNPDGLPVGVTKEVITEGPWKGVEAGINCAACHDSELH
jgi:hypothetical protein